MPGPVWIGLVTLLLLVIAAPWLAEALRRPVRPEQAPGQIARLSQGNTHYRWTGPETGPVALCIHGMTTPDVIWGDVAVRLAGRGFRVLGYDLYGRGYSYSAPGEQDMAFFLTQAVDLLQDQKVEGKITLLGYSMGGAIAAGLAAENPERFCQVVLVAPAGMGMFPQGMLREMRDMGRLGSWMFGCYWPWQSLRGARTLRNHHGLPDGIAWAHGRQAFRKGFVPACLSSLRGVLRDKREAEHRAIAAAGVPVALVWGEEDFDVPVTGSNVLWLWNNAMSCTSVPGADHWLPLTHPDVVAAAVSDPSRIRRPCPGTAPPLPDDV